jgi:hypothetical protein
MLLVGWIVLWFDNFISERRQSTVSKGVAVYN